MESDIIFRFFGKYFWLLAMIATSINAIVYRHASKKHIQQEPELAAGYKKMIHGFFFWTNIPWLIMGIGCTVGGIPTVFHFFSPKDGNPFVLGWWISVVILNALFAYWILFGSGTEKLIKYRMISFHSSFRKPEYVSNPMVIKLIGLLALAMAIIVFIFMWKVDVPLPPFLTEK